MRSTSRIEKLLLKLPGCEEAARILYSLGQIAVQPHRIPGDPKFLLESLDQPDQMRHLALSERLSITIADQADPDGVGIVLRTRGSHDVGSGKLIIPSVADVDFTIRQAVSVADDEVVAESLVSIPEMLPMDGLGRPEGATEMVDDDAGPPGSVQRSLDVEDRIPAFEHLVDVGKIRQGEAATGHAAGIETQEADAQAHGRDETRPDDLRPPRNRSLRP